LRSKVLATAVGAAAFGLAPFAAEASTLVNAGFEDDLSGWTVTPGFVHTTGSFVRRDADGAAVLPPYEPVEGDIFATIEADQPDAPTLLSQSFHTSGGLFSGWAAFVAEDEAAFDDFGFVRIIGAFGEQTLFSRDIAAVGSYGATPWTFFSLTLAAGDYTIVAGASNAFDDLNPSYLLVDGFQMAEVPEPAAWSMMLLGFLGLGAVLRRRQSSVFMAVSKA
jgi:hypothetical protein